MASSASAIVDASTPATLSDKNGIGLAEESLGGREVRNTAFTLKELARSSRSRKPGNSFLSSGKGMPK